MNFKLQSAAAIFVILAATFQSAVASDKLTNALFDELNSPIVFGSRSASPTIDNEVLADVVFFEVTDNLLDRLQSDGFEVIYISKKYGRGSILINGLDAADLIGSYPEVQKVYLERGASTRGALTRQGVVTSRAAVAMNAQSLLIDTHSLSGDGVSIGIISDSFKHTGDVYDSSTNSLFPWYKAGIMTGALNQISGDLPTEITILDDHIRSIPSDEGAAMAELIYDIAPNAKQYFHTSGDSLVEFAEAIDHLCLPVGEVQYDAASPDDGLYGTHLDEGAGADIVVDDIFFISQLIYQDDIVAQAASDCVDKGIHYFSAAGNDGDSSFNANFNDINSSYDTDESSTEIEILNDLHDWSNGDSHIGITLEAGEGLTAVLHWNQPALSAQSNKVNAPEIDLNLHLSETDNSITSLGRGSSGTEIQDGSLSSADPIEYASYTNTDSSAKTIYLAVEHHSGNKDKIPQDSNTDLEFTVLIYSDGDVQYDVTPNGSTMLGHTNADGVNSIAAVPWWETEAYLVEGGATSAIDPESFTARGGVINKFFDSEGYFFSESISVPTLSAVDGNNTSFFGSVINDGDEFPNFFGTSAAAPNAAAIAALLLEVAEYSPEDLTAALQCSAIDVTGDRASIGYDDVSGSGLINPELPLVDFSGDLTYTTSDTVSITTSVSSDNYPASSISWSQVSGPSIEIPTSNSFSIPSPNTEGIVVLNAEVINSCGLKLNKELNIMISNTTDYTDPIADAGWDITGTTDLAFKLSGIKSYDNESTLVSYDWSQVSGPDSAISQLPGGIEILVQPSDAGTYVFELTVVNSNGLTGTDMVTVVISDPGLVVDTPTDPTDPTGQEESNSAGGSSGGGAIWWMLLFLLPVAKLRK